MEKPFTKGEKIWLTVIVASFTNNIDRQSITHSSIGIIWSLYLLDIVHNRTRWRNIDFLLTKTSSYWLMSIDNMGHLKNFPGLGMNINSDKYILPDHCIPIEQPHYKGDGNHSVDELQKLCKAFEEYCHQQAIIKNELIKEIRSYPSNDSLLAEW